MEKYIGKKMRNNKILHCMDAEPKFMQPFIDFVKENFDYSKHKFIIREHFNDMKVNIDSNTIFLPKSYSKFKRLLIFMYQVNKADKIILHGLFHSDIIYALLLQPWILKKCYWIMWGGDFYFPEKQSWIKKQVIKRMGYLVNGIPQDYEVAKKIYHPKGEYIECFVYPSNLYKEYDIKPKEHNTINILLGNSATKTNEHFEVLDKLAKYKNDNIKIYAPLSYGGDGKEYAKEVILKGKEIFGDKFIALTEFMPFEKYLEFLGTIDISIFAHKRMQAFGNIITLIGLGKTIYLNGNVSTAHFLNNNKVVFFNIDKFDMSTLNEGDKKQNIKIIKEKFSERRLIQCLQFLK